LRFGLSLSVILSPSLSLKGKLSEESLF